MQNRVPALDLIEQRIPFQENVCCNDDNSSTLDSCIVYTQRNALVQLLYFKEGEIERKKEMMRMKNKPMTSECN